MNETKGFTVRKIVVAGVLSAVAMLLGLTRLGFIPWFSGASLTVMHVPVIIGAIIEGPLVGCTIGFLFGLFSLIQAAIAPTGPIDIAFTNPLISILPRIVIGLTTWAVYQSFKGKHEVPALITASIVGSLTNTVLVLSALGIFAFIPWGVVATVAVGNGLPEAAAAAVLSVAVVAGWKRLELGRTGSDLVDDDEEPKSPSTPPTDEES
jgi:uncharacterized membrane protein